MANRAYVSLWSKGFSEATMLEQFQQLLTTVPLSAERPGFTELVIRAVDPTETPLGERDLAGQAPSAAAIIELAAQAGADPRGLGRIYRPHHQLPEPRPLTP